MSVSSVHQLVSAPDIRHVVEELQSKYAAEIEALYAPTIAGCRADVGSKSPKLQFAARAEELRLITAAESTAGANSAPGGSAGANDAAGAFSLADLLVVSGVAVRGTVGRGGGTDGGGSTSG